MQAATFSIQVPTSFSSVLEQKPWQPKPSIPTQSGSGKAMPLLPLAREWLLLHVMVAQDGSARQESGLGQPKPAFSGAARTGLGCQVGWWRALAVTQQAAVWDKTLHESCWSSGHLQGNTQTGLVPFLLPECTLCQQQHQSENEHMWDMLWQPSTEVKLVADLSHNERTFN